MKNDLRGATFKTTLALGTALIASVAAAQTVHAQNTSDGTVEEVVVTATRAPTRVEDIGSSVNVIDRQEIEEKQYRTVTQALETVPGLRMVQQGPRGTTSSVFTRGAASNQTLVLLNGQRIADPSTPSGAFDFSDLTTDNVERIEVVRGPQSSLFGSDAIAGVINIITRQAEQEGVSGSVTGEIGTLGTFDGGVNLNGRQGPVSFDASLSGVTTGGDNITPSRFRPQGADDEDDGHRSVKGALRLGYDISESLDVSIYGELRDTNTELDDNPDDPNSEQDERTYFTSAELSGTFWDGRFRPSLTASYSDFVRDNDNPADPLSASVIDTRNEGDRASLSLENEIDIHPDHTLIVGGEVFEESFESSGSSDFSGFVIDQESAGNQTTAAVFVQDIFHITERLSGTAGVRYDKPDDFDGQVTWHVAPTYRLPWTGTRLKGSVGTGFKTPSLLERFGFNPTNAGTVFRGNPDLDAEESFGWEIGFEQPLLDDRLNVGATYFRTDIDDGVTTVFDASFNSTTVNNVDIETEGVESFVEVQPLNDVNLRADYTYLLAQNEDTGAQLVRRPRHKASLDATWRVTPKATLTGGIQVLADIKDIGLQGGQVELDDYAVARVAGSYQLTEAVALTARVENLTDNDYEVADGFKAPGLEAFFGSRVTF